MTSPRKLPSSIPEYGEAICDECGTVGATADYVAVRTSFVTACKPQRHLKSVTTKHLCADCLESDEIFSSDFITPSRRATQLRHAHIDSL